MKLSFLNIVATLAVPYLASARYVLYLDEYHLTTLPNKTMTAGIDTVVMAFANSSYFTTDPPTPYVPFKNVSSVREMFDDGVKIMIAIGGWGDTAGFSLGATNNATRALWAKNVAQMVNDTGFDGVTIDWEYPGGNGDDYKITPNSAKISEITTYPLLLNATRNAIGSKLLSIAVPGKIGDMIAFTTETCPQIIDIVDFVDVMTYDLMDRRDTITKHHTDVNGSSAAIDKYLSMGFCPEKLNLGIAFYAKWFATNDTSCATKPLGCNTTLLEDAMGVDTGMSGTWTYETANYEAAPTYITTAVAAGAACGASVSQKCPAGSCCSQYGFCGNTTAHCGLSCQSAYGTCSGATAGDSWPNAVAKAVTDEVLGGKYYWDPTAQLFWTMDSPEIIARKFDEIVKAKGLGGVFAWSAGDDSYDWSHLKAVQKGMANSTEGGNYGSRKREVKREVGMMRGKKEVVMRGKKF